MTGHTALWPHIRAQSHPEGSTLMTQPHKRPHFPTPSPGFRLQCMKLDEGRSVTSDSLRPRGLSVHGSLQARILERVAFPFSRDLPNPWIEPRSPALQADSLPAEPPRKPKNPGVGSCSLLQQIFPTQESDWGLQHCRWILCQLSHRGAS